MSVQFTAFGIVCNTCGQTLRKLASFNETMEAHDCPGRITPQSVEPEQPTQGHSIYSSTPAERRNARPTKKQQLSLSPSEKDTWVR